MATPMKAHPSMLLRDNVRGAVGGMRTHGNTVKVDRVAMLLL